MYMQINRICINKNQCWWIKSWNALGLWNSSEIFNSGEKLIFSESKQEKNNQPNTRFSFFFKLQIIKWKENEKMERFDKRTEKNVEQKCDSPACLCWRTWETVPKILMKICNSLGLWHLNRPFNPGWKTSLYKRKNTDSGFHCFSRPNWNKIKKWTDIVLKI